MTKEILIKFLNNRCTRVELNEVIQWANAEALNAEYRSMGFDDWKNYQEEDNLWDDEKFSELFDKIQEKIDSNSVEHKTGKKKTFALPVYTTWFTKAAAILLIPVLAFLFYTLSEKKLETNKYANLVVDSLEVIAPIGSRTVVQLSDGSIVHLNYGSKIKYPQVFSGETREILFTGEGFFDVAHNPEKPFIVKTRELNIIATGTAFNVQAYANNDIVETTLVNGKVVLEQYEVNGNTKTIGTMEPGQHVSFNSTTGLVKCNKGNVEKYIAWKEGKLVFDDATITQVAERLGRMFNVDIQVGDNIKDYIYSVTFVDEPLFQILDLMTIATPITYKTLPRKKLADGTFSKQKIIISKRN